MAWLTVWLIVVPMLSIVVWGFVVGAFVVGGRVEFVEMLGMVIISAIIGGGVGGIVLYLVSLPFLFLAMRNALFASRFENILRLTPAAPARPVPPARPAMCRSWTRIWRAPAMCRRWTRFGERW